MKSVILFLILLSISAQGRSSTCFPTELYWKNYLKAQSKEIGKRNYDWKEYEELSSLIKDCSSEVEYLQKLNKNSCLENLKNFSNSVGKDGKPGHSYGFLMSDNEYFSEPRRQELLKLPPIFDNGLPLEWKTKILNDKYADGSASNWEYANFRSRLVPNITNLSYDRLTFFRQNDSYDQWIQFTEQAFDILKKTLPGAFAYIDVIVVERKNKDGVNLDTPKIHFKEYKRNYKGEEPKLKEAGISCYACHSNGPRPISPDPISVNDTEAKTIEKWNKIMSNYKGISYDEAIIPEHNGPALGSNLGKYSCTKCHNGFKETKQIEGSDWKFEPRGEMNFRTYPSHVKARMVEMLEMPTYIKDEKYMSNYKKSIELLKFKDYRDELNQHQKSGINYHVQERLDTSIESTLKAMKNIEIVDEEQYKSSIREVKSAKKLMNRVYDQLTEQYKRDLTTWLLKLDKPECAIHYN
jgi:hypothetical protein